MSRESGFLTTKSLKRTRKHAARRNAKNDLSGFGAAFFRTIRMNGLANRGACLHDTAHCCGACRHARQELTEKLRIPPGFEATSHPKFKERKDEAAPVVEGQEVPKVDSQELMERVSAAHICERTPSGDCFPLRAHTGIRTLHFGSSG